MREVADQDKVWVRYKDRWYPGVLETWNREKGALRCWVSYAVPINGWPGGWYQFGEVLHDLDGDPNDEAQGWVARVEAAARRTPTPSSD
ncbi:hypothetical protein [Nocardioides taihuensis]|uniref:Uncharacterized protein n=1 Tax=Nocardioides taihuensis TaxID=1835606 RepID=A0ABW0BQB7_9ACTN